MDNSYVCQKNTTLNQNNKFHKFDIFCVNPCYPPPNLPSSFSECLPKFLSEIAEQHVVSTKAKKYFTLTPEL